MNRRLAALDVGDKRIGVAVSDASRLIAQPLGTVQRRSLAADCAAIEKMLETYDVEKVIAGLPLNSGGQEGEQADRIRHFCARFTRETGKAVEFQDESYTTVEGQRLMIETGQSRRQRREKRDQVAAAVILQAWLDARPAS
jgi:putative holliday junction resolvase